MPSFRGSVPRREWTCISKMHWRSVSKSARAYRAPSAAGISWLEVGRRTTRDVSSHAILDDIHPVRDSIGEAIACAELGGSHDIQTDMYIDSSSYTDYEDTYADQTQQWDEHSIVGDALLSSVAGDAPWRRRHRAPLGDTILTHTEGPLSQRQTRRS